MVVIQDVSKVYKIYEKPSDRLRQMFKRSCQYYREFAALSKLSFSIRRGETFGIIGRNGSGKSTLLQMICGTVAPTTGQISIQGRIAALLELGAGFNPEFTGRDNILLNAAILGYPKEKIEHKMSQVIGFSELEDFIDQPVKTYSSGMYARLAFSVAIHVEPEILIVDEALAVGDARFVAKCMRRINEIRDAGTTIIFVSHDISSIRSLCDRVLWLDKGRLIDIGEVFPITSRYMEYMFKEDEDIETVSAPELLEDAPRDDEEGLDDRPSSHWGSNIGIIKYAAVQDKNGKKVDLISWGQDIRVEVRYQLTPGISIEDLVIAFSIKDLKGNDILVSTFQDQLTERTQGQERSIQFSFRNYLASGRYLLVATVEKRNDTDVHYYEYYEGAHYFVGITEEKMFGIFSPEVIVQATAQYEK
ncbi:ABC transporter ATP-binding protein [Alcaligenes sp. DN25]|uniref:ABC transporter ATP-binding protein n=1 Tax=Alcaligenes TaxID=507 RepID=UPI00202E0ABD|nr:MULTISPECIES: ABC transporter ATP-binding protein [Alcaligenes]URW82381.1 ABC transporter ATP-binding protein [Alcaligenes sp. DN25]WEA67204.1 ABC transporter ATP-binding protein [Alcaligenes faecalis]